MVSVDNAVTSRLPSHLAQKCSPLKLKQFISCQGFLLSKFPSLSLIYAQFENWWYGYGAKGLTDKAKDQEQQQVSENACYEQNRDVRQTQSRRTRISDHHSAPPNLASSESWLRMIYGKINSHISTTFVLCSGEVYFGFFANLEALESRFAYSHGLHIRNPQ